MSCLTSNNWAQKKGVWGCEVKKNVALLFFLVSGCGMEDLPKILRSQKLKSTKHIANLQNSPQVFILAVSKKEGHSFKIQFSICKFMKNVSKKIGPPPPFC